MLFNNGSFSSVSRSCTLTMLCPEAHTRFGHIRKYTRWVTIECKPPSTIARFKNAAFRKSDNQSTLIFKKCLGLWIKLNGLNEWRCYVRASKCHHLCLWSTMRILALYCCWRSKVNYSQKIDTKCDGIITNCDSLVYYKVRWTFITNWDSFLFGRGPNRVMETACFDANVQ